MQTIQCPFCESPVGAADLNLELVLARCRSCHAVFQFGDVLAPSAASDATFEERLRPAEPIELPAGMRREDLGDGVRISIPWYNAGAWVLAVFATLWDGFMVVWYTVAIAQGEWMMALFGLLHLTVGIGMTIGVAASFLNRTRVRVDAYQIEVSHGPIPVYGKVVVPSGDVEQLFMTKGEGKSASFELYALLRDGSTKKLLGVSELEQGHYLEQQLEAFLNIPDQRVKGEL